MAFKMKSGNKPGFKNMGSSPVREHNMFHKTANFDGSLDVKKEQLKTDQDNKLNEVNIPDDKPVKRDIVGPKLIPTANTEPTLVKADDTKFQRSDKQRLAREKVASDVNAFVSGVAGVPGDVIEGITSKVSAASNFVKKGIDKRKAKKLAKKEARKKELETRKNRSVPEKIETKGAKKVEVKTKEVKPEKVVAPKRVVAKKKKAVTPKKDVVKNTPDPKNEIKVKKQASNNYTFNNKPTPEAPKSKPYVKPKPKVGDDDYVRVAEGKELKKLNKKPSKLSKFIKSDAAQNIGVGVAKAGVTAGINALASGKKKTIRERPNIAGGFSNIKFGRKSRLTD